MKSQNKAIYEQIMRRASKEIMRILNEDIQRFDTGNYQDNTEDILDHDTIDSVIYKKPENEKEEEYAFEKINVSSESLKFAEKIKNKLETIIKPLMNVKISKECLKYNDKHGGAPFIFYLRGGFMIGSKFKDDWEYDHIENTHWYATIDLYYDIKSDQFKLEFDEKRLAKIIEFCIIYKYSLFFEFTGHEDYYECFQNYVEEKNIAEQSEIFILITDLTYRQLAKKSINYIFNKVNKVYAAFVEFVPKYLKEFEETY